ncbi:MAG: hydrogenase [Deferrisomatales bacterium]
METVSNLVFLVVLLSFWVLAASRLATILRALAVQGAAVSLLPLVLTYAEGGDWLRPALLAATSLAVKAGLMPWLLWRAIRTVSVRREVEPLLAYGPGLLLGAAFAGMSFVAAQRLGGAAPAGPLLAGGLATTFLGLLILVGRTKAVTQVAGYLLVENGIFVVGLLLHRSMPLMVEAGILLDAFTAVFLMGIFAYRIQQTFDHMDVHNLAALKD